MGKINVGRWILSGVIAAIVLLIVDYVLNRMILAKQWDDAMTALGLSPFSQFVNPGTLVVVVILNLIIGLTAMWIYVGIRPRFGAGPSTAVYAGLATWLIGNVAPHVFYLAVPVFPATLVWATIIVGIVAAPLATVIGAYFYQEESA